MQKSEKLNEFRKIIDDIDHQLIPMFVKRMRIAEDIAQIKRGSNLAITDSAREQEVIDRAVSIGSEAAGNDDLQGEIVLLMRSVIALSKERQRKNLIQYDEKLLPPPKPHIDNNPKCAFAGVPGAWGEQAALKYCREDMTIATDYFEDVFMAVKQGKADYGVVPIENSQTGAIGEVYDLLRLHGCYIVGQTWIDALQCLLAPKDVAIGDIREVFSHPEGFKQCRLFLKNKNWDLTACRNTAVAAQMAANANNGKTAAIGSRRAAELYGLNVLAPDIMDASTNRTRFFVIAREPEYDSESNLISVTFSTAHRSGALCDALMPFMAAGVNLSRIESRPTSGGKYRFFADLQGNIDDAKAASAMWQTQAACDYFEVLGCFKEI